jgi:hypothetical protein
MGLAPQRMTLLTVVAAAVLASGPAQLAFADCMSDVSGKWEHPIGGTWTISGSTMTLELNSENYGPRAKQITVLKLSSCEGGMMTYRIIRAALINTIDPTFAYEKTRESTPDAFDWSKEYKQPFELSRQTLKYGNYTYTKQ